MPDETRRWRGLECALFDLRIGVQYRSAKREIFADLKIDIKNLAGDLRSALDYLAHYINRLSGISGWFLPVLIVEQCFSMRARQCWWGGLTLCGAEALQRLKFRYSLSVRAIDGIPQFELVL
jgi:hypothetical protein